MGRWVETEITKEEYELDDEDWLVQLAKKYSLDTIKANEVQRNFDGKKYTLDIEYPDEIRKEA